MGISNCEESDRVHSSTMGNAGAQSCFHSTYVISSDVTHRRITLINMCITEGARGHTYYIDSIINMASTDVDLPQPLGKVPEQIHHVLKKHGLDLSNPNISKAIVCKNCGAYAKTCMLNLSIGPGTCLILQCSNRENQFGKKCYCWYLCVDCQDRVDRRRVDMHFKKTTKHQKSLQKAILQHPEAKEHLVTAPTATCAPGLDEVCDPAAMLVDVLGCDLESIMDPSVQDDDDDDDDAIMLGPDDDDDRHLLAVHDAHVVTDASSIDDTAKSSLTSVSCTTNTSTSITAIAASNTRRNTVTKRGQTRMANDLTVASAYAHLNEATLYDVVKSFGGQTAMLYYHVAEWSRKDAGVQYLITRAFQKTEFLVGGPNSVASVEESQWHFHYFQMYMAMGAKMREQLAVRVIYPLARGQADANSLFQATRVLTYKELNRFYGRSNRHSLWNTLPIPKVENINGIAYVNPCNVVRYFLSFATEVDPIFFQFGDDADPAIPPKNTTTSDRIYHIGDSESICTWKNEVKNHLKDAPQWFRSNYPAVLMLWAVDWRDGFGANRTKQNRKSTNAWTFSLSTPKDRVNSLSNTLPIALGLKKNPNWKLVEHRFREDTSALRNGLELFKVYHPINGKAMSLAVLVRRIACLTDKIERGDYTATLSCNSGFHRYYGYLLRFEFPYILNEMVKEWLNKERTGASDSTLHDYGWSCGFVDRVKNGGRFPACLECRRKTVEWLRQPDFKSPPDESCKVCGNWVLDKHTEDDLMCEAPKGYPPAERCMPDCPIDPPKGREPGRSMLPYIKLDFSTMKEAVRFAFFHTCSPRARRGWTKTHCKTYLRVCGLNTKEQDLVAEAADKAFQNGGINTVDLNLPDRVATYEFPAAWNGDMPAHLFIEMLMHLLFLGIGESNFTLGNEFMQKFGRAAETFKKTVQVLLKELNKFNLSWLLIHPFSGGVSTSHKTGTWVSENWLAWVRISKVIYAYCLKRGLQDLRLGACDMIRVVTSFTALVARVLTHAGASEENTLIIHFLLKEFLSSIRELDVRTRYETLAKLPTKQKPDDDQWWMKSNYVSCLNLVPTIRQLGPLVNFWDGGGKAERYIQEIKPHIPRGVRDGGSFFVRLLEKVFKLDCIRRINHLADDDSEVDDDDESVLDEQNEVVEDTSQQSAAINPPPVNTIAIPASRDDDTSTIASDDRDLDENDDFYLEDNAEERLLPTEEEERWSTPMEAEQMNKARTCYIYKREANLQEAIEAVKPISGIVVKGSNGSPEMYVVYKKPKTGGILGWKKAVFDDANGLRVAGLWYAPLSFQEAEKAPKSKEVSKIAKMATVAIPLRYTYADGAEHPDGPKYCVLTNWWRERDSNGDYFLPSLAFDFYPPPPSEDTN